MTYEVVLGLDVGGSSVKHFLAPASASDQLPKQISAGVTDVTDADLLGWLVAHARTLSEGYRLTAVAVSVPGLVDAETGTVIRSSNLPVLDGMPLADRLSAELGVPASVLNDGRAAASSEARWGAGAGVDDVFTLALGTGIAGAHIVRGQFADGASGLAGELGHVVVRPDGHQCSCGLRGCLETEIGAPALQQQWLDAGGSGSTVDLMRAYETGEEAAVRIVEQAARNLARAILTLLALVDPGIIAVGGGLASAPHRIVGLAAKYTTESATFHRVPPIVPAQLGRLAGAIGAAAAARDLVTGVPA